MRDGLAASNRLQPLLNLNPGWSRGSGKTVRGQLQVVLRAQLTATTQGPLDGVRIDGSQPHLLSPAALLSSSCGDI